MTKKPTLKETLEKLEKERALRKSQNKHLKAVQQENAAVSQENDFLRRRVAQLEGMLAPPASDEAPKDEAQPEP
jgi:hypothetical protein